MKIKNNKHAIRTFLLFAVPICIILNLVILTYFNQLRKNELETLQLQELNQFKQQGNNLDFLYSKMLSDIDLLAYDLEKYNFSRPLEEDNEPIQNFFLYFNSINREYNQVRFLDTNGIEKVRINYAGGVAKASDIETLQNKNDRYYIKEAKKLKKGEVYFSKIDLNVENGRIETPYKPVIRVAKKTFDKNGNWKGIIVTNYYLKEQFANLNTNTDEVFGKIEILNNQGYRLLSKDTSIMYGFMKPGLEHTTIKIEKPEIWKAIKKNDTYSITDNNGIWIYHKYKVFDKIAKNRKIRGLKNAELIFLKYIDNKEVRGVFSFVGVTKIIIIVFTNLLILTIIVLLVRSRLILHKKNNMLERSTNELRKLKDDLQESLDVKLNELLQSEKQLSALVESAGIGVALVGLDGKPAYVNSFLSNMLGYTPDELQKMSFAEFTHPDDLDKDVEQFDRLIKDEIKFYTMDKRYIKKNGELFWGSLSVSLLKDKDGKVQNAIGTVQDINELKITSQKLLESESKFKAIFNESIHFIGLLNPDGTLLEANQTALKFAGIDIEDIRGVKFWDISWWSYSKSVQEQLKKAIKKAASGELISYEVNVKGAEERIITIEFSLKPVKNKEGEVILLIPEGKDLTAKLAMENALRASEAQLKLFVKHTPAAVAMFDTEMKYLLASEYWYNDYQITDQDIIGKSHYEIFPKIDNIEEWKAFHKRCLNGEIIKKDEEKFIRSDGSENWIRWQLHPWYKNENEIGGIIMYTENITKRKESEKKIFEQAQLLDQIVESVISTDLEGNIKTWNKGSKTIFGYTKEEVIGKNINILYPKEDHLFLQQEIIEPLIEIGSHDVEVRFLRKNQQKFYGFLSLNLLYDETKKPIGMIGSTIDITELKNREIELKQQKQLLSDSQAIAHLGSWEWDVINNEVSWSDELYKIFEIENTGQIITYELYLSFIPEEDRILLNEKINEALDKRTDFTITHRLYLANNKVKHIQGHGGVYVNENNEVVRMYGTALDITDQINYENNILMLNKDLELKVKDRTKELEKLNKNLLSQNSVLEKTLKKLQSAQIKLVQSEKMASIGTLSAGIAHEINNPINFIAASTNVLKRDHASYSKIFDEVTKLVHHESETTARIKKFNEVVRKLELGELQEIIPQTIEDIETGVDRTIEIIEGLRNFARHDEQSKKKSSLHGNLESTLLLLKNKTKNGIQINKNFDERITEIDCFPGQLNQVFMNLIVNAIDVINGEGKIDITTKLDGNKVKISIKDNGPGISQEIINKIFDPFFTTKEVGKGVGLGLSISHSIIEKHGGKIDVSSKTGDGTEFIVTLPL